MKITKHRGEYVVGPSFHGGVIVTYTEEEMYQIYAFYEKQLLREFIEENIGEDTLNALGFDGICKVADKMFELGVNDYQGLAEIIFENYGLDI